jgi:hypothetical protein
MPGLGPADVSAGCDNGIEDKLVVLQEAGDQRTAADGGAPASNGVRDMVRSRRDDSDGTPAERGRAGASHRGSDAADDGVHTLRSRAGLMQIELSL